MVMYDFLLRHQGSLRLRLGTDVYSLERAPFYLKKKQFSELNTKKIVFLPEQIAQMLSVLARPVCSQYLVLRLGF